MLLETFKTTNPEAAVVVSRVIPPFMFELLVSAKRFAPVPLSAVMVSLVAIVTVVLRVVPVLPVAASGPAQNA